MFTEEKEKKIKVMLLPLKRRHHLKWRYMSKIQIKLHQKSNNKEEDTSKKEIENIVNNNNYLLSIINKITLQYAINYTTNDDTFFILIDFNRYLLLFLLFSIISESIFLNSGSEGTRYIFFFPCENTLFFSITYSGYA